LVQFQILLVLMTFAVLRTVFC